MVTATQLSSYLYCPRKLFISNVLLIKEPPKAELVKGRIWHETYETINKNDELIVMSINTKSYQDIYSSYRRYYSKFLRNAIIKNKTTLKEFQINMLDIFKDYWQSFDEEAKERALNLSNFIERNNVFGKELWDKLTPKLLSEQFFKSEKLNLSGVIDIVEIHDNKSYMPVELKTGKVPDKGMWDGHRIQLAAYMLLLEDAGKNVGEAVMKYRGAEKRILSMNSFLKNEVIDLIKKTKNILESFNPPKYVDNRNKCKSCQFKETCYNQETMKTLVENAKMTKKAVKNVSKSPSLS